jgi:hypothetical protein
MKFVICGVMTRTITKSGPGPFFGAYRLNTVQGSAAENMDLTPSRLTLQSSWVITGLSCTTFLKSLRSRTVE